MNIANLYRKLKQILIDSNEALKNRGLNAVDNLYEIPIELNNLGIINKLIYFAGRELVKVTSDNLIGETEIKPYAFYNCNNLTSIEIPDSITSIGAEAFFNCYNLKSIELPDSLISIENSAFSKCEKLESIIIPDNVTSIAAYAFGGCTGITSITISKSVTDIDGGAFESCRNLKNMYLFPIVPPSLGYQWAMGSSTSIIHVPIGSGNAYKSATNWSKYADRIVEDIIVE